MRYRGQVDLVENARLGRTGLGWLFLGTGLAVALTYTLTITLNAIVTGFLPIEARFALADALMTGTTPTAMLILLGSFTAWLVALAISLRVVHQRPFWPALGAQPWLSFLQVLRWLIVLNLVVLVLPPWGQFADVIPKTPLGQWLALLPLSVLAVLIQVSAEEIFFRGYLQQQLAARFASPFVWMVIPSALFALGHIDPAAGSNTWYIVLWAGIFGLLMADLTARAGSIGPAIAVHLVNNLFSLLVVALPGSLDGLALYTLPTGLEDEEVIRALLPIDFAMMLLSWLTARLVIRR